MVFKLQMEEYENMGITDLKTKVVLESEAIRQQQDPRHNQSAFKGSA